MAANHPVEFELDQRLRVWRRGLVTALAIRTAEKAGITLIALARGDEFEIFTHSDRIYPGAASDVA